MSLTFDDGPSPFTEGIVAALRAGQARATFFDVGNRLAFWPDAVRATATVGSMGVHTWTHAHLPRLKPARVRDELLRTQLAIFRTTRQLASVFRPPYEQATVRDDRIAESLNLLDVRWNVDSLDSRHGATSASAVAAVAASVAKPCSQYSGSSRQPISMSGGKPSQKPQNPISTLSATNHIISVNYSGDANFATATTNINQTVIQGGATITVSSSVLPSSRAWGVWQAFSVASLAYT